MLGSEKERRHSLLLRKFASISIGGSDSLSFRGGPPDIVLCVVDHNEVLTNSSSSSGAKKATASLLNEIKHLNCAVLAIQAIPLLVVVSPTAELVVDSAERRRLASVTHLITVAGGVIPVVGDNCSMVEAAVIRYGREKHSRL